MSESPDGAPVSGVRWSARPPFAIVPEWVLDSDVCDRAVRLYAVLARYADGDGSNAFPRRKTLAARLGCSTSSLDAALAELKRIGAVTVVPRRRTDGSQTSNEYVLSLDPPDAHPAPSRPVGNREQEPSTDMEPLTPNGVRGSAVQAKQRPRNLPFDALVESCPGTDPSVDGAMVGKALQTIRRRLATEAAADDRVGDAARGILAAEKVNPFGADVLLAEEVRRRAVLYRQRWPEIELTPTALAKHWTRLLTERPSGRRGVTTQEIWQMAQQAREERLRDEGRSADDLDGAARGLPAGELAERDDRGLE